jgi:hypothetical protein
VQARFVQRQRQQTPAWEPSPLVSLSVAPPIAAPAAGSLRTEHDTGARTAEIGPGVETGSHEKPVSHAGGFGHAFGRISILPPRAESGPPAIQRAPDPAAPVTGPGDGSPKPGGDGPVPLDTSGAAAGATTIQDPPTMQTTILHGTKLADLAAAMSDEAGSVEFDFSVATQGEPSTSATLDVTQTMTLPQWAERDTASQAAQRSWDRFLAALRQHENGHLTIDKQMFTGAHRRFVGIPSAQVEQKSNTLRAQVQAKQDAFDTQTDHGRKGSPPTILDTTPDLTPPAAPKSATADEQTGPGATDLAAEGAPDSGPPSLQARLFISAPDDPYEREANAVADQIVRRVPDEHETLAGLGRAAPGVQRLCAQCAKALDEGEGELCPECAAKAGRQMDDARLSRKEADASAETAGAIPPAVDTVLQTGGEPLDRSTRADMEGRFGHDFSRIRIHSDHHAAESARSINALAYTVGEQVVFGAGRYAPQAESGRWLLAHELTHVLQQRGNTLTPMRAGGLAIQRDEDKKEDFDTEQRRLIKDAKSVGDVKDINPQAFHLASDDDRFRLIFILLNQGWVGPRDEYYLEHIWGSFGKNLQDVARKNFAIWNLCVDRGADLWGLPDLLPIQDRFKADVVAKTKGYLAKNRAFIQTEQKRLGLDNPQAPATADQQKALVDIKQVAKQVSDAEMKQTALRDVEVGYNRAGSPGDDPTATRDDWNAVRFDPDTPPQRSGPKGGETHPMATWEATNKEYQQLESTIKGFANRYPTIYALRRDNKIYDVANGTDDTKARQTMGASLQGVLDNIATTEGRLADPKGTLALDLHPVHQQLFTSPGSPWQDPFGQAVAKATVKGHEDAEWWTEMGVTALQLGLFAVAELATGGAATVFFLAISAGVGAIKAEQSWEKYQEKSAAANANLSDETRLLESGEADAALVTAVLDTATAFLDLYGAGSSAIKGEAQAIKQLEERFAAAEAKEAQSAVETEVKQAEEWQFKDELTGEAHSAHATDRGLEICSDPPCLIIPERMRERFGKLPGTPSADTTATLNGLIAGAEENSNAWKTVKKELDAVLAEREALEKSQGGTLTARLRLDYNQKMRPIEQRMGKLQDASQQLEEQFEALGREHKVRNSITTDEGMTQPHGASDAEVRKGLGMGPDEPCADILSKDASGRWVITESKGGDIDKAIKQLENTANRLVAKEPTATTIEFRVYPNEVNYRQMQTPEGLGLSRYRVDSAGLLTQDGALVTSNGRSIRILPPPGLD